jgi:hypothetical protein
VNGFSILVDQFDVGDLLSFRAGSRIGLRIGFDNRQDGK